MDKRAANDHLVMLQKEIKNAKSMVSGNLIRKISKLKQEADKLSDQEQKEKIEQKIEKIYEELKLLKKLDGYTIAKKATINPNIEQWQKIISHSKATPDDRLTGRVILKNRVQKQVAKFRSDHKDCDEWFNEYIEFREKKRELLTTTKPIKKRKK